MIVAFVPVRGGSKSIPLKNIKQFCSMPLVYWSLKALQDTESVDEIVVATDSLEIKRSVESFNLSKVKIYDRDPANASDTASTESVMLEYINHANLAEDDLFMLVQATSPLTRAEDFRSAISKLINSNYDSLVSCVETKRFYWNNDGQPINYDPYNRPRRQDFDGWLMENGAFYINKISGIKANKNRLSGKILTYLMPEYTGIEIDEEIDWVIAESIMRDKILASESSSRAPIKLFLTDVDGTLTDSGMYYSSDGSELKKFNTRDGKAFELLRNAGIKTGIITTETTEVVTRRARKIKADFVYQGAAHGDKLTAALEICKELNIDLINVAYIGDDVNCKELLESVGIAACPLDAAEEVKSIDNIKIMNKLGGGGAVREFADLILAK